MKGKIILGTHRKPNRYFIDGRPVTKKEYDLVFPSKSPDFSSGQAPDGQGDWIREVVSDGLAVIPRRIEEAEALCRKHGVPTDFSTKRGRPILKSKAHRKEILKIFKKHDNQGFY